MTGSRAMFWRILRRQVFANRGRLLVVLLALSAGAAITAALLNLQVDAKRRLTTEFRSFGANVLVTPKAGETFPIVRVSTNCRYTNDRTAANMAAFLVSVWRMLSYESTHR